MNFALYTFDTNAAAAYLDLSYHTLVMYRTRKTGPTYVKFKTLVRYSRADLDAWYTHRRGGICHTAPRFVTPTK